MLGFPRVRDRGRDFGQASASIKAWVRDELSLGEDDAVTVSEISCRDSACPRTETAILVLSTGGRTRVIRVARAMGEVGLADVQAALGAIPPGEPDEARLR